MPLDPRAIIAGGENAKTEFKRDDRNLRPERLAREIAAFANMNGGVLVLGVEDDGRISGVTRRNLQAWLMDSVIGRFIDPQIVPDYDEFVLDDKQIAIVTVPAGSAKPYAVRQQERTDYYIRLGDTVQRAGAAPCREASFPRSCASSWATSSASSRSTPFRRSGTGTSPCSPRC